MTRVLVIEDEESYREALSYMLGKEGFDVVEAADGAAGLAEYDRVGRRHRAARPDDARHVGHRGVPAAAARAVRCR